MALKDFCGAFVFVTAFVAVFNIYTMAEDIDFKFGTQLGFANVHHCSVDCLHIFNRMMSHEVRKCVLICMLYITMANNGHDDARSVETIAGVQCVYSVRYTGDGKLLCKSVHLRCTL